MEKPKVSSEEISIVTNILNKLEPGFLPLPIFIETSRLILTSAIELIPLRINDDNNVEVLMTRREKDDPVWPNMWHTPGTILRATDSSLEAGLIRVKTSELSNTTFLAEPTFSRVIFEDTKRGKIIGFIHWINVGDSKDGEFFELNNLPLDMVQEQKSYILETGKKFKEVISALK